MPSISLGGRKTRGFVLLRLPRLCYAYEEAGDPSGLQAASQAPGTHSSSPPLPHHQPVQRGSGGEETHFHPNFKMPNVLKRFILSRNAKVTEYLKTELKLDV